MKIKALITLHVDGKSVLPGKFVDVETEEAKSLIKRGFASNDKVSTEAKSAPDKPPVPAKPAPTLEDIVDVIHDLDPSQDYGKSGKPNVDALEVLLDTNISAQQRDAAWEVFLKEQEADQNAGAEDADNETDGDSGDDVQS
tara:strand:- start:232 stop:654 length:423 start_codon:yes stop_codon:yes gene_type:complete